MWVSYLNQFQNIPLKALFNYLLIIILFNLWFFYICKLNLNIYISFQKKDLLDNEILYSEILFLLNKSPATILVIVVVVNPEV